MAGLPGLIIKITADTQDAVAGINRVESALGSPMGAFDKLGKTALAAGGALAAAFGAESVIRFLQDSMQAAMEDEKSMVALAKAMENVGVASQNASVEAFVKQLSLATGVADDQLRPALQRIVTVTGDVAKSQEALKLALDISAGSGKDLESVSTALAKAYGGQTTALGRLGVGLDQALLKSKDMDAITAALSQKFQGQAAAAAETYQGKLNQVTVAANEAKETIGYALLNAIDNMSRAVGGTGGATSVITKLGDAIADLISTGTRATSIIGRLGDAMMGSGAGSRLMTSALDGMIEATKQVVGGPAYQAVKIFDALTSQEVANARAVSTLSARYAGLAVSIDAANKSASQRAGISSSSVAGGRDWGSFYQGNQASQKMAADARTSVDDILKKAQAAVGKSASGGSGAMKEAGKQISLDLFAGISAGIKTASDPILTELSGAMDRVIASAKARDVAANTVDQMKSVAGAVSTQITDLLNSAQNSLEAAKTRASDWAKNMASTIASGFDLESSYKSSIGEDGKVSATKWIDGVNAEVSKFEWFGNVLAAVKANGGANGQALSEYLASKGVDAGGAMGQAMIDNGLVQTMADKMAAVQTQAAATADLLIPESLRAGVESAQATYDGLKAALGKDGPVRKAIMSLMDNLAEAMKRSSSIDVYITRHVTTIESMVKAATGVRAAGATGAIVSQPTIALIGEAGPEAVVPLNQMPGASPLPNGTGGNTYNVNVSTGVGDPRAIGQQVVEYITRWENANGQRYARV